MNNTKSSETKVNRKNTRNLPKPYRLTLSERISNTAKREAFITLEDHKPKFKNIPSYKLINLCKPELSRISQQIVENIFLDVKAKTNINQ